MYGDPRWDGDELWTIMGHLYKGGMWFKKKSVLQVEGHYSTLVSADNTTDLRSPITWKAYANTSSSINSGIPSAANIGDYFYLPALGHYNSGQLYYVGSYGYYWSSSAYPLGSGQACGLGFGSGVAGVDIYNRSYGHRVGAF